MTDHPPLTSDRVRHLAGKGLREPRTLTPEEIQELCGSVLRHLEGQNPPKGRRLMGEP